MKEINYIGEHLWAGKLGNAFLVLSFVTSLTAFVFYYLSSKDKNYLKAARYSFYLHSFSVIGIAATLFFMLFNHFYEYQYVWQHSNDSMPMKYIASCFWEGQEGSFLLWTFWNVVLGLILRKTIREDWEAPVMTIFSLVQVFLASMLLGIYLGDHRIGSSPFLLLREHPDYFNAPFVQSANYLAKLSTMARGLNPLLMNYWMTIHPPTLFLGFSSTLVPFAFAVAALWKKKYNEWQSVALPWTFFGVFILGTGVLMGGAWAYEALSFGGFWAWDPVENSSLVPWLILVGAGHVMIVNKNRGGSLFTTHLLAIGSFLLVLYSTFMTRSGILGESSVHAFTDLGMQGQLVIYVLTFVLLCVAFIIEDPLVRVSYLVISLLLVFFTALYGYKKIALMAWVIVSFGITTYNYFKYFPKEKEEEEFYSREFWMFLGALVLMLSSLIITYFTSIPVINKLFDIKRAPLKVEDYNLWMIPFAVILAVLIAAAQFLKFKSTDKAQFYSKLKYSFIFSFLVSAACTIPLYFLKGFSEAQSINKWNLISYALLFFTAAFALVANTDYWLRILKGKVTKAGGSVAHIGFALILIGALVSTSKKQTLSKNTSNRKVEGLGKDFDGQKNILLAQGDTLVMGPYMVSYEKKEKIGKDIFYTVNYFVPDENKKPKHAFSLRPKIQLNERMGNTADPDTKHYLNRDIYTHITYADLNTEGPSNKEAFSTPKNYIGHLHDTIFASNAFVIIDSLKTSLSKEEYQKNDSLLEITAVLKGVNENGEIFKARPKYVIKKNMVVPQGDEIKELGLKFTFWNINPEEGSIEITMAEKAVNSKDFIVMEAHMFPYINVLWLGCVVMGIGSLIAIVERVRKLRITNSKIAG